MSEAEVLKCQFCGAVLDIPEDFIEDSARCGQCGKENVLPPQLIASRLALVKARLAEREADLRERRFDAEQAEKERRERERKRAALFGIVRRVFGVVFAGAVVIGGIFAVKRFAESVAESGRELIEKAESAARESSKRREASRAASRGRVSSDPKVNGLERMQREIASLLDEGCGHVVTAPNVVGSTQKITYTSPANAPCLHILATTGSTGGRVEVRLTDQRGKALHATAKKGVADLSHCPEMSGPMSAEITGPSDPGFTIAAVDCPRAQAKHRDDRKANGFAWLAKQGRKGFKGCERVLLPAQIDAGKHSSTATLSAGACLRVLSATGVKGNALAVSLRDPGGVERAPRKTKLRQDFQYCAKQAGAHPLLIQAELGDYFSTVALLCREGLKNKLKVDLK